MRVRKDLIIVNREALAPALLLILVTLLAAALTGARTMSPTASWSGEMERVAVARTKLHASLLEMAERGGRELVPVIVQGSLDELAAGMDWAGGSVRGHFGFINALSAVVPADRLLDLAQSPAVTWISPDGPMVSSSASPLGVASTDGSSSGESVFVTWSTALGVVEKNDKWYDIQNIVDPAGLGPDGVYGHAYKDKASFAGFEAEVTPGYAISKVELLLAGYAATPLPDKDLKIRVYLNGKKQHEVKVRTSLFNSAVGAQNAGAVVVDLTGSHAWRWEDFSDTLEISLELGGLDGNKNQVIYLDAVGLRVTASPDDFSNGEDNSQNDGLINTEGSREAMDISRLAQAFPFAVRAPETWNEAPSYLQGQNVTVAVVDSGVGKLPNLRGRKIKDVNFNEGYHDGKDRYGHGTFVASMLAGDGKESKGKYIGIAPKVDIVNVRVSDDQGMSTEGDVIAALEWVFDHAEKYNIRVVNLSLNATTAQSYHTSPLDAAVEMLWLKGIVVVVSAGNNGSADLYPPANSPRVITVGATDDMGTPSLDDDVVAPFSAWGVDEAGQVKPDLVAPGTNIVAYMPKNAHLTLGKEHKNHAIDKNYFRMSGTSMSAPVVSGAAAILLQDEPYLTPDQVKYRLMATANRSWPGYDPARAGAGYLDIYAAVHGTSTEYANVGVAPSELLRPVMAEMLGDDFLAGSGFTWSSVNWSSVNWNSVNWNSGFTWSSVNWDGFTWSSTTWGSDYWDDSYQTTAAVRARLMRPLADPGAAQPEMENKLFLPTIQQGR